MASCFIASSKASKQMSKSSCKEQHHDFLSEYHLFHLVSRLNCLCFFELSCQQIVPNLVISVRDVAKVTFFFALGEMRYLFLDGTQLLGDFKKSVNSNYINPTIIRHHRYSFLQFRRVRRNDCRWKAIVNWFKHHTITILKLLFYRLSWIQ